MRIGSRIPLLLSFLALCLCCLLLLGVSSATAQDLPTCPAFTVTGDVTSRYWSECGHCMDAAQSRPTSTPSTGYDAVSYPTSSFISESFPTADFSTPTIAPSPTCPPPPTANPDGPTPEATYAPDWCNPYSGGGGLSQTTTPTVTATATPSSQFFIVSVDQCEVSFPADATGSGSSFGANTVCPLPYQSSPSFRMVGLDATFTGDVLPARGIIIDSNIHMPPYDGCVGFYLSSSLATEQCSRIPSNYVGSHGPNGNQNDPGSSNPVIAGSSVTLNLAQNCTPGVNCGSSYISLNHVIYYGQLPAATPTPLPTATLMPTVAPTNTPTSTPSPDIYQYHPVGQTILDTTNLSCSLLNYESFDCGTWQSTVDFQSFASNTVVGLVVQNSAPSYTYTGGIARYAALIGGQLTLDATTPGDGRILYAGANDQNDIDSILATLPYDVQESDYSSRASLDYLRSWSTLRLTCDGCDPAGQVPGARVDHTLQLLGVISYGPATLIGPEPATPTLAPYSPFDGSFNCAIPEYIDAPIADISFDIAAVQTNCYILFAGWSATLANIDFSLPGLEICLQLYDMPTFALFGLVIQSDWVLVVAAAFLMRTIRQF